MTNPHYFRKQRLAWTFVKLLMISAVLIAAVPVHSQDKKEPKEPDDVIKVTSNLVSLDVIVKDKKGKTVTDLKAEDFTVIENGVTQQIEFFDATLSSGQETNQKPGLTVSVSTPPKPRTATGFPRNIIALVLDGQSTELANLKHVREGMEQYIRKRISDSDSVAIFAISGGLQLLQPFTQDKAKLIAAVENAYVSSTVSKTSEAREISERVGSLRDQIPGGASEPIAATPGAGAEGSAAAQTLIARHVLEQYIQLRSVLSGQQTRPVLAALAAISEGLRSIPGKKTLVLFSQGFVAPETLDWQVQTTIDLANRANVAIYIIDSSGLTGGTPQSGALVPSSPLLGISAAMSQESRIRAGAGESVFDVSRQEGLNRQRDLLYRISGDTGGQFIKNTNDIGRGLERIDAEIRSRYTLAYRSTDSNFDGSFRKVKIEVRRPGTIIMARPGYYAIPPNQIVPLSAADRKLLANMPDMEAHPTLPLSLELNSFRSGENFYIVPLSFEIPPAAVQFDRKGDKQRLQLEVLGVIRAEGEDKILTRLGGNFDVALTADQYESVLNNKIFYRQDMQLQAGNYTIDLIVKDRVSGKMAARREKLALPASGPDFWATEPVLSRHVEPLGRKDTGDVLGEGGVQIRPSPSREFRPTDNLIIFFSLYNAAVSRESGKPLVTVAVKLIRDGKPAMRPIDDVLTDVVAEPVPHLSFARYIKLAGLATGNYSVVIEARDVTQNMTIKREARFVIVK